MTEAQTRFNLIDKELNNINDTLKVIQEHEIELDDNLTLHFDRTRRFVDYVFLNKTGHIIAVVEAERENKLLRVQKHKLNTMQEE